MEAVPRATATMTVAKRTCGSMLAGSAAATATRTLESATTGTSCVTATVVLPELMSAETVASTTDENSAKPIETGTYSGRPWEKSRLPLPIDATMAMKPQTAPATMSVPQRKRTPAS